VPTPYPAALRARLTEVFRHDLDSPLNDAAFNDLALAVFGFQYEHNQPFAAYCRRRSITPDRITHWAEIPAVPTAAFRQVALTVGPTGDGTVRFRTSGTTQGSEQRGIHYVPELGLYHEAMLPMFTGYLLPDSLRPALISLIPHVSEAPDSSLSHMVSYAAHRIASDSGWFMDAQAGLQEEQLEARLHEWIAQDRPILMVGTSFAYVHWLDSLARRNLQFRLPERSRLMDTGGFKGKSRVVPEDELRAAYQSRLGVRESHCVNEYGMTELLSQFYDTTLRDETINRAHNAIRLKRPAPWVRTRVVDPETLVPVHAGTVGILQHFDLANLYSVLAVQTEDLGRMHESGFETLGRAPGAVPRGCSVAVDLLLQAVREGR
jgi:hypothetical protein